MQDITKKQKIFRTLAVLSASLILIGAVIVVLILTGWYENMNSVEKLKNLILRLGFYGRSVFVILQFLQVTFIPLPSTVLVVAGTLIYGPAQASLLSLSGILLGSAVAFFLGRVFGKRLVKFMVGEKTCNKWIKFLNNGKYSFVIMMLLPFFPDDVLCLVAGVTDMSWTFFMITQFVSRPLGIYLTSYLSSGDVIPYHGWGLGVWFIIFVLSILAIYFSTKYKDKIEENIAKMFKKRKKM